MSEERAKPVDEPKKGAPLWVVTFTDMSSLLLTFFILILTFSSQDQEQRSKAEGSLQGAFGVVTGKRAAKPHAVDSLSARNIKRDRRGPTNESLRSDQVAEKFDQAQNREIFNTKIEDVAEGFRLEVEPPPGGGEHFNLWTGEINAHTETLLKEMGTLLRSLPCRLVVRSHIDSRTWRLRPDSSAREWTLEQALTAAEALEASGLPPERISVSPRGDLDPVDRKDTELARYRNRRLEILVIPDDRDPLYQQTPTAEEG